MIGDDFPIGENLHPKWISLQHQLAVALAHRHRVAISLELHLAVGIWLDQVSGASGEVTGGQWDETGLFFFPQLFYRRFFAQQFKRSCLPDGPKVGSVALSPRGDWRMPSDASVALWLAELDGES